MFAGGSFNPATVWKTARHNRQTILKYQLLWDYKTSRRQQDTPEWDLFVGFGTFLSVLQIAS
jgi:hypothetical protein